jgi:glucose-1-phosphate adenylyltransferase
MDSVDWYQGTADAVRQHLQNLQLEQNYYVLVLAGDHLYRMDYRHLLACHIRNAADMTVGAMPVPKRDAPDLGILQTDASNRVVRFVEKPKPEELPGLESDPEALRQQGIDPGDRRHVASMGIYVFSSHVLAEVLADPKNQDFGRDIIPDAVEGRRLYGFYFDGYWRDIGTVRNFYEANLDLTAPVPPFNFFDETAPMYTRWRQLPPTKLHDCQVRDAIVADGAVLDNCNVRRSVIGVRSVVRKGTQVEESVLLGADYYEDEVRRTERGRQVPLGVGANCVIRRAIIDKNARIGDGVRIVNERGVEHEDGDGYCVREGIVAIPRSAVIPSGTVI